MAAIVEAAEEVFAAEGLHAAHMGEIARRAGVAVGTVYNHFADRDALLGCLLETRRQELLGRIDGCLLAETGKPFERRLRALLDVVLDHAEKHRRFFQILLQAEMGQHVTKCPASGVAPVTMKSLYTRVESVIKDGVAAKAVRTDIADLGASLFMGMWRAVVIRAALTDGSGDLRAEAERLVSFYLHGVSPQPKGQHR